MSLFAPASVDAELDSIFKTSAQKFSRITPTAATVFSAPVVEKSPAEQNEIKENNVIEEPASTAAQDKKAEKKARKRKRAEEAAKQGDKPQAEAPAPAVSPEIESMKPEEREKLYRTVFVGNVSSKVATDKATLKTFKELFKPFGKIDSIRFRSVAFNKPSDGKFRKVEFIKGDLHDSRDNMNAYVVFADEDAASKAVSLNATVFEGKHLRVDLATAGQSHDHKRSIFIGNLAFDVSEEDVWAAFASCGDIQNVRIVRDKVTNVGKGIGYVLFKERSSTSVAMQLNDTVKIKGRTVRVTRCVDPAKRSEQKQQDLKRKRFEGEHGALRRLKAKQPKQTGKKKSFAPKAAAGKPKASGKPKAKKAKKTTKKQ